MINRELTPEYSGWQSDDVPRPFSELTPEDFGQLSCLLDDHLDQMQQGCVRVLFDGLTGKMAEMNRRLDLITNLAKLPDRETTEKVVMASSLIVAGSRTPEEVMRRVKEGVDKATDGGPTTGYAEVDEMVRHTVRFSILVASKLWRRREQLKATRESRSSM